MSQVMTEAAFTNLSNVKLAKLFSAKELRAFAKELGLNLKGDARRKGVKYGWVRQIKTMMEIAGFQFT